MGLYLFDSSCGLDSARETNLRRVRQTLHPFDHLIDLYHTTVYAAIVSQRQSITMLVSQNVSLFADLKSHKYNDGAAGIFKVVQKMSFTPECIITSLRIRTQQYNWHKLRVNLAK